MKSLDFLLKNQESGGRMLENIKSKSVFLYDLSNEKVIYEKNPDLRLPFASITKVITAILAIEKCTDPKNTMIEMEEKVINDVLPLQPSLSPLSLYPGRSFPIIDFIYATLVKSGCAAARQLALYAGNGDLETFLEKASELLHRLGCNDTKIIDPTGIIDEGQYSTVRDITRFFIYAMENPLFASVVSSFGYRSIYFPENLDTTNALVRPDSIFFNPYVIGGKTGTTDEAGRCIVCCFEGKGKKYVLAALGFPFINDENNRYQFYAEDINSLIFSTFKEEGDFAKIELPFHIKRVHANDEFKLEPTINNVLLNQEIKYTFVSENESVASVDNSGHVKVHAPGFTQIEVITNTGDYDICYIDSREEERRIRTPRVL